MATSEDSSLLPTTTNSSNYSQDSMLLDSDCKIVTTVFEYLPWDNEDNFISYETSVLIVKIVACLVAPCLAPFGIVTNIVNTVVFFK